MTPVTTCRAVSNAHFRALRRDLAKELTPKYKNARANAAARSSLADPGSTAGVTMVFAYRSPAANHREHQEKESCYLQPEHMQHAAYTPKGDAPPR